MRLTHIMLDCIYIYTPLKRLFILYLIPIPIPISYNSPRLVVFLKVSVKYFSSLSDMYLRLHRRVNVLSLSSHRLVAHIFVKCSILVYSRIYILCLSILYSGVEITVGFWRRLTGNLFQSARKKFFYNKNGDQKVQTHLTFSRLTSQISTLHKHKEEI